MSVRRLRMMAALLLPLSALTGCSEQRELTILAAASLTDVFTELADDFEASHEGVEVRLSFGSSTTLAEQAVQGAHGDVLATADELSMRAAEDGDALAAPPIAFATNRLVLVVPKDNPGGIATLADLEGADWVRCADDVPCGRVALGVLDGGTPVGEPASLEVDVRSVLAKVASGEADAGFVYATDAAANDEVRTIPIPGPDARTTCYVAALGDRTDERTDDRTDDEADELAADWIALLTSPRGRAALEDAGFTLP